MTPTSGLIVDDFFNRLQLNLEYLLLAVEVRLRITLRCLMLRSDCYRTESKFIGSELRRKQVYLRSREMTINGI